MPTKRHSEAKQRRETDHLVDETMTVDVVGDLEKAIDWARPGRKVLVADMAMLGSRMDQRVENVRQIFEKGATIQTGSGLEVGPENADIVIELMSSSKRTIAPAKAKRMGGWNRASDEEKAAALVFWNDHDLTPKQVAKFSGFAYTTLYNWFHEEYPRPDRRGKRGPDRKKRKVRK